ncbi:MAG TPA: hypothetical protein VFO55_01455 [Gemmatimonadaceae bacterium]|nr:hypothetical protein [Gemmatimonadaceae bacterium]
MSILPDIDHLIARAGTPARATVHAAGVDTAYLRVGSGEVLVFVVGDLDSNEARCAIDTLAAHFRVIAAAPDLGDVTLATWLHGFTEGLGIGHAHVMLHAALSPTLMLGDHDV